MRILLPVDLDTEPQRLVDDCAAWAARIGGTVDLLYVDELAIPLPHVKDPQVQKVLDEQWSRARVQQEAALTVLRNRMPEAQRGQVRLASGAAAKAILGLVGEYDLLMVGTHGRTGLARMWLGSVAEQVVRQSAKPVLVLRLPQCEA